MKHRNVPAAQCVITKFDPNGAITGTEIVEPKEKRIRGTGGPRSSTRSMTDEDARRVKFGDHKDSSHGVAASALGLSYGQVYSARKGFTFTHITG